MDHRAVEWSVPEEDHPFRSIWERASRGKDIYDRLRTLVDKYQQSEPYKFSNATDEATGDALFCLDSITPLPTECAYLASEFLHHMRGTLDNLAYTLGHIKPGSTYHPDRISFPIFEHLSEFAEPKNRKALQMFDEADLAQIISMEPASDGIAWFWILHRLNNMDKHRVPLKTVVTDDNFVLSGTTMYDQNGNAIAIFEQALPPWLPGMVVMRSIAKGVTISPPATVASFTSRIKVQFDTDLLYEDHDMLNVMANIGSFVQVICQCFIMRYNYPGVSVLPPERWKTDSRRLLRRSAPTE